MLLARHGLAKCPPREDTDGPPGEILGDAPGAPTPQPSPHRARKPLSPISVPCLLSECRNCGCGGRRQPHWPWEVRLKAPSHIQSGETNPTPEDMSHWNWARPQGGSERAFQVGREAADASEARLLGGLHPQPIASTLPHRAQAAGNPGPRHTARPRRLCRHIQGSGRAFTSPSWLLPKTSLTEKQRDRQREGC